jgi:hypothetical protein
MFDDDSVVWLRERKKGFEGFGIFLFSPLLAVAADFLALRIGFYVQNCY